jgi:hypothetical protein
VLPKLTAEDLKDLDVAVVGHRKKIMSAIEARSLRPARQPRSGCVQSLTVDARDRSVRRSVDIQLEDFGRESGRQTSCVVSGTRPTMNKDERP